MPSLIHTGIFFCSSSGDAVDPDHGVYLRRPISRLTTYNRSQDGIPVRHHFHLGGIYILRANCLEGALHAWHE